MQHIGKVVFFYCSLCAHIRFIVIINCTLPAFHTPCTSIAHHETFYYLMWQVQMSSRQAVGKHFWAVKTSFTSVFSNKFDMMQPRKQNLYNVESLTYLQEDKDIAYARPLQTRPTYRQSCKSRVQSPCRVAQLQSSR